jgi:Cu-Zn family superoxide dismutase
MKRTIAILALMIAATSPAFADPMAHGSEHAATKAPAILNAVAVLSAASGSAVHGVVRFTQDGASVKVVADIEGLNPGQQHAMHVHECGDCTAPDAASAGGHYNPEGHAHALPVTAERHAGDLGNLTADSSGKAHYEITVDNCSIAGMKNPILGRAIIVHAKLDDGGQPTGNAGGRVACGVIGVAKAPEAAK